MEIKIKSFKFDHFFKKLAMLTNLMFQMSGNKSAQIKKLRMLTHKILINDLFGVLPFIPQCNFTSLQNL